MKHRDMELVLDSIRRSFGTNSSSNTLVVSAIPQPVTMNMDGNLGNRRVKSCTACNSPAVLSADQTNGNVVKTTNYCKHCFYQIVLLGHAA